MDLATLVLSVKADGAAKAKADLDGVTSAAGKAEAATRTLGAAQGAQAGAATTMSAAAQATAAALGATATAGQSSRAAINGVEQALGHTAGTAARTREALVLLHEFLRGDFKRAVGSATIELQNFGLLGAVFSPLGIGALGLAGALGTMAFAAVEGEAEFRRLNGSLIATGHYAGLTVGQVDELAKGIAASSDATIGSSRKTVEALAETGKFSGTTIANLAQAAENYAKITGRNAEDFVKEYEAMGDHVVEFAVKHQQTYHDLTLAQVEHIALLVKEGRQQQAQDELSADLAAKSKDRLQEAEKSIGFLQQVLHQAAKDASEFWDALLGIGRPKTLEEQIHAGEQTVFNDLRQLAEGNNYGGRGNLANTQAALRAKLHSDIEALNKLNAEKDAAEAKAKADAAEAARQSNAIGKQFGDGRDKGRKVQDDSDVQIDQAKRAELAAQLALTKDVSRIADLKVAEVNTELKAQEDRLALQRREGRISEGAESIAKASYEAAAAAKREADYRDELVGLIQHQLDQERVLAGYGDRMNSARSALTQNAQQLNAIEDQALARRQADERKEEALRDGVLQLSQAEREARQKGLAEAQFGEALVQAQKDRLRLIEQSRQNETAALQNEIDLLSAEASISKSAFARATLEKQILDRKQQQELVDARAAVASGVDDETRKIAQDRLDTLRRIQGIQQRELAEQTTLANAISEAASAAGDFASAIQSHDWGRAFAALEAAIETAAAAFRSSGLTGGLSVLGGVAGQLIGGKAGNALGLGAGIASIPGTLVSLGSLGALGGLSGAALGIGAALAPFALPVGIVAGLASLFIGSKPSNHGAGFDLDTGAITGNKRDADTEKAVVGSAQTILQAEQALKDAGASLTTTIRGLVIGTRDQSQIYTSDGRTLTSAVGDASAAAETALKAVLQGATFTNDAEKRLVDSMLAAGKGFDDVLQAIQNFNTGFTAAQQISGNIASQIQQLTDPQGYEIAQVKKAYDDNVAAAQAAANAGYLTADQLSGINAQLARLEGLQLDQVTKKYADAAAQVADAAAKQAAAEAAQRRSSAISEAQSAVDNARSALKSAYDAQVSTIKAQIDQYTQLHDSLKSFRETLDSAAAGALGPQGQYFAARRAFLETSAAAQGGDATALGKLQSVSQAYLDSAKAVAPSAQAYARDLAAVRNAVTAAEQAAGHQVDAARAQLTDLDAMVSGLGILNTSVLSVKDAILGLQNALALRSQVGGGPTAAETGFDVNKYLADNPDLAANFLAGGSLTALGGSLQEAAYAHYLRTGQYEIAAGTRKFATGGSFTVGGSSTGDRTPVGFMANGGEVVNITRADTMRAVLAELKEMRQELAQTRKEHGRLLQQNVRETKDVSFTLSKVSLGGTALRTVAA